MTTDRLAGKVVVVTGASAGVGRATVRAFARQGASLGLIARDQQRLEAAQSEVLALGSRAVVAPADVADANALETAASRIEEALGPIDIWVNNAMVTVLGAFDQVDAAEFERVTAVTYLGNVNGTRAALSRMMPRDRGCIVQVGSALAYQAIPLQSAYCGAKHAIKGFSESVRAELIARGSNVQLTMVELPAVNTPQFDWARNKLPRRARPLAPVFQPEVAAEAVVWASTAGRREVLLGTSTVLTVWGSRLIPAFMSRFLARTATTGQQGDEPEDPRRPDNLWQSVPGETGARGRFSAESWDASAQLWATRNRSWLALGGLAIAAGIAAGALAAQQRRPRRHERLPDRSPKKSRTGVRSYTRWLRA